MEEEENIWIYMGMLREEEWKKMLCATAKGFGFFLTLRSHICLGWQLARSKKATYGLSYKGTEAYSVSELKIKKI